VLRLHLPSHQSLLENGTQVVGSADDIIASSSSGAKAAYFDGFAAGQEYILRLEVSVD